MTDSLATQTCRTEWDAVVIGAGPAGGLSAALLVSRGFRTLLLERSSWPRDKACGGCLNAAAVATLRRCGIEDVIARAAPVTQAAIQTAQHSILIRLEAGIAILRRDLDAAVVETFVRRGGAFVSHAVARVTADRTGSFRTVAVKQNGRDYVVNASVVIVCDGIDGTSLRNEGSATWHVSRRSWIGVASARDPGLSVPPATIAMHVGTDGYVGLVGMGDGSSHLAAALSPSACRDGGLRQKLIQILHQCGSERAGDLADLSIIGTGVLTRQRSIVGSHRMLIIGDACGYVEPFTGEGIAWALQSAEAAISLLPDRLEHWPQDLVQGWSMCRDAIVRRQQIRCHAMRYGLHSPRIVQATATILAAYPRLAEWAMR